MNKTIGQFFIWHHLPNGKTIKVGGLGVEQADNGKLTDVQFAYSARYLSDPLSIPLDPVNAPFKRGIQRYPTSGKELPGFIDDCLPDAWGRKVIASRLNQRHVDTLTLLGNLSGVPLGALQITPSSQEAPQLKKGIPFNRIALLHDAIYERKISSKDLSEEDFDMIVLGGSSPGGARPKLLVTYNDKQYLAKFNQSSDDLDNIAMEWASMSVAHAAGIDTAKTTIAKLGTKRCLLVERFDVAPQGGRHHMLTLNAMLKDPHTQEDAHLGSYEDIAATVKSHCQKPRENLKQLLGQMLLNGVLHNTDDHLRNFSLLHNGKAWQLSPAYDIVPHISTGSYHQINFMGKPYLPKLDEAAKAAKAIGLAQDEGKQIADNIYSAMQSWPTLLEQAGAANEEALLKLQLV